MGTISLNSIEVKHERRIRLIFSEALDVGAFGVPAPAYYVVTCTDSLGVSPGISAAIMSSTNNAVVELTLTEDLVKGSLYTISAVGVPGVSLDVTPDPSLLSFRFGFNAPKRDVEPIQQNRDDLVYGIDLLWNGADYQETASGDLDRVGGTANVTKALYRGLEGHGMTWDPTYGAHVRDFVDSPSTTAGSLKGNVQQQILSDPRVKASKIRVSTEDDVTYLIITPTLISGAVLKPVSLVVPSG